MWVTQIDGMSRSLTLEQPDTSVPHLPDVKEPPSVFGRYVGVAKCIATHPVRRPPVPYGKQGIVSESLWFEDGYKECVGYLTEGRYLVFEKFGQALTNAGNASQISTSRAHPEHREKSQRWVIHYSGDEESQLFHIASALDGKWIGSHGQLLGSDRRQDAADIQITFLGNGQGYSLQYADSTFVGTRRGYQVWSVTYH